jgi:hypothetical protein
MTTSLLATAQPRSSRQSTASLPSTELPVRHAEIEFRDLRYFAAVAEELHFSRAVARLYITHFPVGQGGLALAAFFR